MPSNYVNFRDFDPAKLTISTVEAKPIPDMKGQNYRSVNIVYNYGTEANEIYDQVLLEYPDVRSTEGIKVEEMFGRVSCSIRAQFNSSEEHVMFLEKMDQAYEKLVQDLLSYSSQLGMRVNKDNIKTLFTNPVYRPVDENGKPIPGRSPKSFLKLINWSKSKTLFTDLDAKPIDWDLLKEVEMEYRPLVNWSNIYVGGGKIRLQQKVLSAVVTRAVALNTETLQLKSIEEIKSNQPSRVEELRIQLEKLKSRDLTLEAELDKVVPISNDDSSSIASFMPDANTGKYGFGKSSIPSL